MYSFRCFGHKNITSSHKNTLEFTKDTDIGKIAHCIIGVNADFSLEKIKEEMGNKEKLTITIRAGDIKEDIVCLANRDFDDEKEIVIRKSEFSSKRTLGMRCDKASSDLNSKLKDKLRNPEQEIIITIN
jgi:hypothetical protein